MRGCGTVFIMDGNIKNHRDVCQAMLITLNMVYQEECAPDAQICLITSPDIANCTSL